MSVYFPYSFIINISNEIMHGISRYAYVGDWSLAEATEAAPEAEGRNPAISELYY